MSKTDRIKEELGWRKVVFAIFVAIDVSLVAWLSRNYESASRVLVVFVTSVVIWVNRAAMYRFKEREKE